MESCGKVINFPRMNRKKNPKVEKTTDKSENQFIPVKKNTHTHTTTYVMHRNVGKYRE